MQVNDKCYVVEWGRIYTDLYTYNSVLNQKELLFPYKTEIQYAMRYYDFRDEYEYVPNLTLKGAVSKREPTKRVLKLKNACYHWQWEILEIIKHPRAGQYTQTEEVRERWKTYDKFTEEDLYLLKAVDKSNCYIIVEASAISDITYNEYQRIKEEKRVNDIIQNSLGKYDRVNFKPGTFFDYNSIPEEIVSVIYCKRDDVQFGSCMTKGKIQYRYLSEEFTTDNKKLYIGCRITYDGIGNKDLPQDVVIMEHNDFFKFLE